MNNHVCKYTKLIAEEFPMYELCIIDGKLGTKFIQNDTVRFWQCESCTNTVPLLEGLYDN